MATPIVLTIPDEISDRARRIAERTAQSAEQVILDHLKTLSAPLPALSPDLQTELEALKQLSDDALWAIAQAQMPNDVEARAHELMTRNIQGTITCP